LETRARGRDPFTLGPHRVGHPPRLWPGSWRLPSTIPFGVVAILVGLKTLAAYTYTAHAFDFPGRAYGPRAVSGPFHSGIGSAPITLGLGLYRLSLPPPCCLAGSDPQTGGFSGSGFCRSTCFRSPFRRPTSPLSTAHRDRFVCGPGPGFRVASLLPCIHFEGRLGRSSKRENRLFHDPLSACGCHHCADRRTSNPNRQSGRFSAASVSRCSAWDGPVGEASGEPASSKSFGGHGRLRNVDCLFPRRLT